MDHQIIFSKELINRYDRTGPRYTSYPTTVHFSQDYNSDDYRDWVAYSNDDPIPSPLSLYVHIPFCNTVCYYCGCNKIVTRDASKAAPYIEMLMQEIEHHGTLFAKDRHVQQMHWGGGTPTFLDDDEIHRILEVTQQTFNFIAETSGEFSIEVDPRTVSRERIANLRSLGFNRISFGIQDFNPEVQQAVNRIHSTEMVNDVIEAARINNFQSINLDLMYGLPKQTVDSFENTIQTTIDASPDRIAVYNYAHLPEIFKPQRRINTDDLPSADEKLEILQMTIDKLQNSHYVYIGMDHFAKKTDALVAAQNNGTLHRNFQGYSTHADCDLVAMGISSISSIGGNYSQNVKTLDEYELLLHQNKIPIYRGLEPEPDDVLRREIINQLICYFKVDIPGIEDKWAINFLSYFESAYTNLNQMADDGLLELNDETITVTPSGRLLVRAICMEFDRYLAKEKKEHQFSRVI